MSLEDDDREARRAAIAERSANVRVDAGAGTGKTTLVVERMLRLIAPPEGEPALPVERVAAITFTRRAAGELILRLRQRLMEEAAHGDARAPRLLGAVRALPLAPIGTIHAFADRLLRLFPVQARISASYQIVEDPEPLAREVLELLLEGAHRDPGSRIDPDSFAEAADAFRILRACGIPVETRELPFITRHGLAGLVHGFLLRRDDPPALPPPAVFDRDAFHRAATELLDRVASIRTASAGAERLRETAGVVERVMTSGDPIAIFRTLIPFLPRVFALHLTRRADFGGDDAGWDVWRACVGDDRKSPVRARPLAFDLLASVRSWAASVAVRSYPVIVELYDEVKVRRGRVDPLDLLLGVRSLLAGDGPARAAIRERFDHVLVDEFQDTDPIQAEIIAALADGRPGYVTIVGDAKQSIYRFRRADLATYRAAASALADGGVRIRLSRNFRSDPNLLGWINDRSQRVLGSPPDEHTDFDQVGRQAFHRELAPGRVAAATEPRVDVLRVSPEDTSAAGFRAAEAEALAAFLADGIRAVRWAARDVAILAGSMTEAGLLTAALDHANVPWSAMGGRLFLRDPLQRRFLLALAVLADPDDGVARAVLSTAPFSSAAEVDWAHLRWLANGHTDESAERARAAREVMERLRDGARHATPGATARQLLEDTRLMRTLEKAPNGPMRIAGLRHLCVVLETIAQDEGLDFAALAALAREWVTSPRDLDVPDPIGADVVRISTIHQAKGLEFPIVVLWDCRATLRGRRDNSPWLREPAGSGWSLLLDGLAWEEPPGLREEEAAWDAAERRRVLYVAMTRARERLVLSWDGATLEPASHDRAHRELVIGAPAGSMRVLNPPPLVPLADPAMPDLGDAREALASWPEALASASTPTLSPLGVSAAASASARAARNGPHADRFGPLFGATVHRAIGLALRRVLPPIDAVAAVADRETSRTRQSEAAADTLRALETLGMLGLRRRPDATLRLEYPVCGASRDGASMLIGLVDLVAIQPDGAVLVIDFKTDTPPQAEAANEYGAYAEQLALYERLLRAAPDLRPRSFRRLLLFTADGSLHTC